jgi:hypothetical protein
MCHAVAPRNAPGPELTNPRAPSAGSHPWMWSVHRLVAEQGAKTNAECISRGGCPAKSMAEAGWIKLESWQLRRTAGVWLGGIIVAKSSQTSCPCSWGGRQSTKTTSANPMNPNDPVPAPLTVECLFSEHPFFAASGLASKRPGPVRTLPPNELDWVTLEDIHPYPESLMFNPPTRYDPWAADEHVGGWV